MSGYDYEYEWDGEYCYPNSYVLKNKLDIKDAATLSEAERRITALNLLELKDNPVCGKFNLKHLRDIHRAIFGDIFAWAGNLRTVDISKGNQFCLCRHLETYSDGIFAKLKADKFLSEVKAEEMPERLTFYLSEINVLHPFRDGNGRAQRVFIEYLAQSAGFYVDFSTVDGREMIEASALSFACEYEMMNDMFKRIISSITLRERQIFREKIGLNRHEHER